MTFLVFSAADKKGIKVTLESTTLIVTTNKSTIVTSGVHETSTSDKYISYCLKKFLGASKRQHSNITS